MHRRRVHKREARDQLLASSYAQFPPADITGVSPPVEGSFPGASQLRASQLRSITSGGATVAPFAAGKRAGRDAARAAAYRRAQAGRKASAEAASASCEGDADARIFPCPPMTADCKESKHFLVAAAHAQQARQSSPHMLPLQSFNWENVPAGLDPSSGNLGDERANRKRGQLASAATHAAAFIPPGRPCHVVDFGAGSGHLGLLLAYVYDVRVVLVEREEYRFRKAEERLLQAGPRVAARVRLFKGSLEDFAATGAKFDLAVS